MEGGLRIKANQEQTLSGKEEFIRRGRGGGEEFGTIENVLEGEMSDEEGSKSRGTASEKQGERGRVSEGGRVGGAQKPREEKGAIVRQLRPFAARRVHGGKRARGTRADQERRCATGTAVTNREHLPTATARH